MNGPCERPLTLDDVRSFNFPVGEMHIQLPENILTRNFVDITYEYSDNESVIKFMMIGDTLKRLGISIRTIYIPYLPFSREDRSFEKGGSFGLAFFADIINRMEPRKVILKDVHSDIALELIKNSVFRQ
jgi:ribose-phosphate pyrophosphokinase